MNLAFALNTYNQAKVAAEATKYDGHEAVKYALDQVVGSMQKLNEGLNPEEKEHYFERALSSIYFLQKCLDFEKGGDIANNLFQLYEYGRQQLLSDLKEGKPAGTYQAIDFLSEIRDAWEEIGKKNDEDGRN